MVARSGRMQGSLRTMESKGTWFLARDWHMPLHTASRHTKEVNSFFMMKRVNGFSLWTKIVFFIGFHAVSG
ncbi:hypothetical protein HMPREF9442_02236 [Paraprevotella xylaniphila YIT 11841]|uniref:Uncharacterized protein n=1 Tax=Paraprevotella xylaniphila YIT 11841 TaxID=762982 RepID=F3QVL1_9BACT|nr:hypothetical protein HMPREF9442_02236 [Paraprevotella xylaniphila YIT 11841]